MATHRGEATTAFPCLMMDNYGAQLDFKRQRAGTERRWGGASDRVECSGAWATCCWNGVFYSRQEGDRRTLPRSVNQGVARATLQLTGGPHSSAKMNFI
jgi:hypothetical protein